MFTGLIEETGEVLRVERTGGGIRLVVGCRRCGEGLVVGASVAVNGCCLTVAGVKRRKGISDLEFDLLEETWARTSFFQLEPGGQVNLERSLAVGGRLGGHFVTGHVDGMGIIERWEAKGSDWLLEIRLKKDLMRYMVPKGSIAVDGISLTVAKVGRGRIRIWIIPHTLKETNLRQRQVKDRVNIEADLLGKYVERLLDQRGRQ